MPVSLPFRLASVLGTGLVLAALAAPARAVEEPLTLRISDTVALPGGLAAVVLRTYAPRSIRQGQVCFHGLSRGTTTLVALEDVVVFSRDDDALVQAHIDPVTQAVDLTFDSPTAGVNWADGPLAVFFLRVGADDPPGATLDLALDLQETFLVDANGAAIAVDSRPGTLSIRDPAAPVLFEAEGDKVAPGARAQLAVGTEEAILLGAGQAELIYDPALFLAPPVARIDPRHGNAVFTATYPSPGRLRVSFTSPDGSLNEVPGGILEVTGTIRPTIPVGTISPLSLDPAQTWLEDPLGAPIALDLIADVVEIVPDTPLFRNGFESGDVSAWTVAP